MPEAVDITKFDVEQVIAYFELDEINATLFREKGFNGAILYESMDSLSEHISHNLFMKITETIEVFRSMLLYYYFIFVISKSYI
jgi:alpha-galactosidase